MTKADLPIAEEVFRPRPPRMPHPAFLKVGESLATEIADKECARLIANCLFDPPITEQEIDKYAGHFKIPRRQAELEIRGLRK